MRANITLEDPTGPDRRWLDQLIEDAERGDPVALIHLSERMAEDVARLARVAAAQADLFEAACPLAALALRRLRSRLADPEHPPPFRDVLTGRPSYRAFEEYEHTVVKGTLLKILELLST